MGVGVDKRGSLAREEGGGVTWSVQQCGRGSIAARPLDAQGKHELLYQRACALPRHKKKK